MNLQVMLFRSKHKRNSILISLSLLIISISFLFSFQYKIKEDILQKQWYPEIKKILPQGISILWHRSPIINNNLNPSTQYNIKMNFFKLRGILEIEFCNKYSFILNSRHTSYIQTGFYHRVDSDRKERVSEVNYRNLRALYRYKIKNEKAGSIFEKIGMFIACDLAGKTASIYINNRFVEKINLDDEQIHYFVSLNSTIPNLALGKMQIDDNRGKVIFNGDYGSLFFYKITSQILFSLGIIIFLAFLFFEKSILRKSIYFLISIILIESFLRIMDIPDYNTREMNVKWNFRKTTNLFGEYNDTRYIQISPSKIYSIAKPENSMRIICIGSSPLLGFGIRDTRKKLFPDLLEDKINFDEKNKCEVVNIYIADSCIIGVRQNIYLRDILFRLNPDIIIMYEPWGSPEEEKKDDNLYKRAKWVLDKESGWIKDSKLLYRALEFKKPIKEVVYSYDFLCKSYLFLSIETIRKIVFNKLFSVQKEYPDGIPEDYFKKTIELCKEKMIKLIIIPQLDFGNLNKIDRVTEINVGKLAKESKDIYYLDLRHAFETKRSYFIAYDGSHPSEYGNMVIAEEIYRMLEKEGLLNINRKP